MSSVCVNMLLVLTGLSYLANAGRPQQVRISGADEVIAGVSSVYECSALCTGVCTYTWEVNDRSFSGRTFTLTSNGVDTSVTMTCMVNDEERKNFVSDVKSVRVINPFSVKPSADQPVISKEPRVGRSFKLTCDGATPAVTIIWLKGGEVLTLNSRMRLSMDNTTLSFYSLEKSDIGQFQCRVLNGSVSVISKDYWLQFGLIRVIMAGPSQAEVGLESEFTWRAECEVDCTVQWALHTGFPKGRFIAEGPKIRWTPSEIGQTQVFTCLALYSSIGKLAEVSRAVTVIEARPHPNPSNAISVKPSAAAVISATLLMLICAWA